MSALTLSQHGSDIGAHAPGAASNTTIERSSSTTSTMLAHLEAVLTASFTSSYPFAAVQLLVHTLTTEGLPSCHPCSRHGLLRALVSNASMQMVDLLLLDPRGARLIFDWIVLEDGQLGKHDSATASANMLCRLLGLASPWLSTQQVAAATIPCLTTTSGDGKGLQASTQSTVPTASSNSAGPSTTSNAASSRPPMVPAALCASPALSFLRKSFPIDATKPDGDARTALSIIQHWSRGSSFSLKRSAAVLLRRGSEVNVATMSRPSLVPIPTTPAAQASTSTGTSSAITPNATGTIAVLPVALGTPVRRATSAEHRLHAPHIGEPTSANSTYEDAPETSAAAAARAQQQALSSQAYAVSVTGSGSSTESTVTVTSAGPTVSLAPSSTIALSLPALSPSTYDISLLTGSGASSLASVTVPIVPIPAIALTDFQGGIKNDMIGTSSASVQGDYNASDENGASSKTTTATTENGSICAFPPLPCASDSFPRPMSSKYERAIFEYEAARREWAANGMPPEVAERYQAWLKQQHAAAAAAAAASKAEDERKQEAADCDGKKKQGSDVGVEPEPPSSDLDDEEKTDSYHRGPGDQNGSARSKGSTRSAKAAHGRAGTRRVSRIALDWAETDMMMKTSGGGTTATDGTTAMLSVDDPTPLGSTSNATTSSASSSSAPSSAEPPATVPSSTAKRRQRVHSGSPKGQKRKRGVDDELEQSIHEREQKEKSQRGRVQAAQ